MASKLGQSGLIRGSTGYIQGKVETKVEINKPQTKNFNNNNVLVLFCYCISG